MVRLTKPKKGSDLFLSAVKKLFFALLFVGVLSCVNHDVKLPEGYISQKDMVPIMVDIHLIEGARSGKLVLGDTNKLPDYYAKIYQKHQVTETNFKESFDWYTAHPKQLKTIYEEVIVSLSKMEEEVNVRKKPNVRPDDYEDETRRTVDSLSKNVNKVLKK